MPKNLAKSFYRFSTLLTLILSIAWPATAEASCEESLFLGVGESHVLTPGDATQWFTVIAPERGLLHVEVRTNAKDEAQPILGYWGTECSARSQTELYSRSPEHLTLEVDGLSAPIFRIALPKSSASQFEVVASLHPLGLPVRGGEDEEIIELDGLMAPPASVCPSVDDHGDSLACASRVSHRGQFNGHFEAPGDIDTFRIVIGAGAAPYGLWRLRPVASDGLQVTLFDGYGLRMASPPGDSDFTSAVALTAGTYFLRVHSRSGKTGAYELALDVEAW